MTQITRLGCRCGKVHVEVTGAPIVSTECRCKSCRSAAAKMEALSDAPAIVESNGGTRFILYRKDRIRFVEGLEQLDAFRLTPEAPTRRAVAACCNTPVFLEFEHGHWLSLYGALWPQDTLPALEMRTMTSDNPRADALPSDIPNGKTQSLSFMVKLLGAWIAMGFKTPKVTVKETLHV
jgi:hypothetical protein